MRGNEYPTRRIISFLVACLFILLLLPAAGVADNEGISAEKTRKSYLDQFSEDGKQIILTAVSKMSPAEINRLLENLEKTISAEGLEDYKVWLTDNGIAVPTESTETNEPEDVYAAISKMSEAEKQAYIERLNNMSGEEIYEHLEKMEQELTLEQVMEYESFLLSNGFKNPNVMDETPGEINEAQSEYEAVSKMSDAEKKAYVERLNKMPEEEITEYLRTMNCGLEPEQMTDLNGWLAKSGFHNPNLTEESGSPLASASGSEEGGGTLSLSDFAKMNEEEQQAFLDELTNLSPEDLDAVMCQSAEGLTAEQKEALVGWIAENNDLSRLDMDNWFSGSTAAAFYETTEVSGSEEDGGTPNLSDFAKMNTEEQQAFLIKLTDMLPEDLNAVMCQSAEGLTEEQKEALIGWVVMTNDLSNLDLDNWFSRTTVSELGETGKGTEIYGERIDDIDLTQGIPVENMTPTPPPDESVEGTKMDEDQVITAEFTLSPEEEQALLQQATGPTQEELSDEFDESRLSGLGEADEGTEIYGERIDDIDLTQGIPVENMTPTPPPDESVEGTEMDEDQAVTVEISLSTEEEQELLGQATGPTPEDLNDTADESDLFGMGDEKAVTGISQASEEDKTKLLDKISKLTAEEFNAFIEALRGKLSEEQMNDFIDWLAAVYGLDTSCPAFSIMFPTSFKVYSDWPWPDDLPMPGQGRIWGYAEGGEAVRFEITHITQPTYDQWIRNIIASGAWNEDAKNGKKEIENASKKSFGPRAQTPEEYYTDKGLEMAAVTYFSSVAGTGCVAVAFGANNALIIATRD